MKGVEEQDESRYYRTNPMIVLVGFKCELCIQVVEFHMSRFYGSSEVAYDTFGGPHSGVLNVGSTRSNASSLFGAQTLSFHQILMGY